MKTHERTIQTLKWGLVLLPFALMAVLILTGCGAVASPVSVEMMSEREVRMYQYLQCYARYHEIREVELLFFTEEKPHCGDDGKCGLVVCEAIFQSNSVRCWQDWVNGNTRYPANDDEFSWVAAHETCHLALKTGDEVRTGQCTNVAYEEAGC